MRYAEVIVDLSAGTVDRRFTYAVPEGMALGAGWQVEVPFGPRRLEGFVLSLKDACDLPPEKVRSVLRAVRAYPVILPEMLDLAAWMHERYLCNLVDALRLMLPAQMRGGRVRERTVRMARLKVSCAEAEAFAAANPRARAQAQIVARLLEAGELPAPALPSAPLRALVAKGIAEVAGEEVRRTPSALRDAARAADPELTPGQKRAVAEITDALERGGGRFLLHGVTGSGKTEVYIRAIRRALELGRTAIVLVPEIALTPQMVSWLHARFGADAAVLHSRLSAGERYDEWRRIRFGEARVVIGARSAVFAPVENLGVIVVDEEHEHTYQSDRRPRYDAREVARRRADAHGGVLILGSATPSIDTYMRAMPGVRRENRLTLIELRERVHGQPLPEVEVVDMRGEFERGNHSIFSARLARSLESCLDGGHQAVLFINRRGYSTFVSCRACGYVVKCAACDVSMTYHQVENALRCHYCGSEIPPPKTCPQCGSRYIKYFGAGTQKVAEEVMKRFPKARGGARGRGHHAREGRPREAAGALPPRRRQRAGRHADDRQGAGLSQRHAGGRGGGGHVAEPAGLPQRGADVPAHHAGGGARRTRGISRTRDRADLRAGSLRHPAGGEAGLSRLLPARERVSPQGAVSAVYGHRAHRVRRPGSRSGAGGGGSGGGGAGRVPRPRRHAPGRGADARGGGADQAAARAGALAGVSEDVL